MRRRNGRHSGSKEEKYDKEAESGQRWVGWKTSGNAQHMKKKWGRKGKKEAEGIVGKA